MPTEELLTNDFGWNESERGHGPEHGSGDHGISRVDAIRIVLVAIAAGLDQVQPLPSARYIAFYGFDNKSETEPNPDGGGHFYGAGRKNPLSTLASIYCFNSLVASDPN